MSSFLGHRIAQDEGSVQKRYASESGYIPSDLPLLNDLGILKNRKLKAKPDEIRNFLHWIGTDRSPPLPPLGRRMLCLKRALLLQSASSLYTSTHQRTKENKQIAEIDGLLGRDGVSSGIVGDTESCIAAPTTYTSPPRPASTAAPTPARQSSAAETVLGGNQTVAPHGCPPTTIRCVCGGDKNTSPAAILQLQTQIKGLEAIIRELQLRMSPAASSTPTTATAAKATSSITWIYEYSKPDGLCFFHSLYKAAEGINKTLLTKLIQGMTLEESRGKLDPDNEDQVVVEFRRYTATKIRDVGNIKAYLDTLIEGNALY